MDVPPSHARTYRLDSFQFYRATTQNGAFTRLRGEKREPHVSGSVKRKESVEVDKEGDNEREGESGKAKIKKQNSKTSNEGTAEPSPLSEERQGNPLWMDVEHLLLRRTPRCGRCGEDAAFFSARRIAALGTRRRCGACSCRFSSAHPTTVRQAKPPRSSFTTQR